MDFEGVVSLPVRPLSILLAAVAVLMVAPGQAAGFQHLPDPDQDDIYQWESVFDAGASMRLAPGEERIVTAPRLGILRVQFESPFRASSTLRIEESTPASGADSTSRALRSIDPFVLDDGDWMIVTGMSHRPRLRFYVDERAEEDVEFSLHKMSYAEPRYYWTWWQRALHDWYASNDDTTPPLGMATEARQAILSEVRRAQHLRDVVDDSGPDELERRAAVHLGHAIIARALQSRRRPHFRYDTRHSLGPFISSGARWIGIDLGDRQSEALVVERDRPQTLTIEGPGVLSLGVRTVKSEQAANTITHYGLRITESGFEVHRGDFSSGIARFDDDDTAAVADDDDPDDLLAEPAPDPFQTDRGDGDDGEASPSQSVQALDQLRSQQRTLHYAVDDDEQLLGWRRRTQMWVPPGTHRFVLHAEDSDLRIDGHLVKPRPLIQQAFDRTGDTDWHIERAEELLSGLDSRAARLLRMEIADFIGNNRIARSLGAGLTDPDSQPDRADGFDIWSARRNLDFGVLTTDGFERLYRLTDDQQAPGWLRREIGLDLAAYLVDTNEPQVALQILDRLPQVDDTVAVDQGRQAAIRSEAIVESAVERPDRWTAISRLYRMWLRHPVDPDIAQSLQQLWWYRTYWRSVEPGPTRRAIRGGIDADETPESTRLLEPISEPGSRVFLDDVADRRQVRFRLPDDRSVTLRTPRPVGDPNRATRLRLAALSTSSPTAHSATIGDRSHWLVHDGSAYAEFDFLTEPDNSLELEMSSVDPDAELFSAMPPEDVDWLPARDVVAPRDYYRIGSDGARFELESPGTLRFVRVHLRGTEDEHDAVVVLDDGIDSPMRVQFHWDDDPQASSTFATSLIVPIAPDAEAFEVRSPTDEINVAVDQRSARPEEPEEPLHVDVELPLDDEREQRLREISRRIADTEDPQIRLEKLVERARLLMSLARDRLAELDLERVTSDTRASGDLLERARRLAAALDKRSDLWWLDIAPQFLDDGPTPLDPRALLISAGEVGLDDMSRCIEHAVDNTGYSDLSGGCQTARRWFDIRDDGDTTPQRLLAFLDEFDDPPAPILAYVADRLHDIIKQHQQSEAGLAARTYLLGRTALSMLPTPAIRTTYFQALRWTSWQRLSLWGATSAMATITDDKPPSNAADFQLPTIDDHEDQRIELAMLGIDWPAQQITPLYSGSRRTLRFRPMDTDFDGDESSFDEGSSTLQLHTTCADLRADLQPPDHRIMCRLRAGLEDRDTGNAVGTPRTPAWPTGGIESPQWTVENRANYNLEIERLDELTGRRFVVYPTLLNADGETAPLSQRVRRNHEIASADQPVVFEAMGPASIRIDVRTLTLMGATSMDIELRTDDGEIVVETVAIDTAEQPGAVLDMLDEQPLTYRTRHLLDLAEARRYRVEIRPNRGQIGLRAVARVDDDEAIRNAQPASVAEDTPEDVDESEEEPTPPAFGEEPMQLELDEELMADLSSSLLALGDDRLLDDGTPEWTTRFEVDWRTRDVDWEDAVGVQSRDAPYAAIRAGIYSAHPDEPLWANLTAGLRAKSQGPPVGEISAHGYWDTGWRDIRIEPRLSTYWQRFEQNHFAIRSSFRATRSDRLAPRWLMINSAYLRFRLQEPLALFRSDGRVDPVMYNDYAVSRRVGYEARSTIWHRPFLNMLLSATGRMLWNPDATFDQTSLQLQARSVLHTTDVRAGYRLRYLFDDVHRDRSHRLHEFDLQAEFASWALGDHLLELGGWSRYSFAPQSAGDPHRIRLGLSLSLWRNIGDFSQIPPSHRVFDHLILPEYFDGG